MTTSIYRVQRMRASGAADENGTDIFSAWVADYCYTATGWASKGGVLIIGRGIPIAEITDGTSNTVAIGEQSDFLSPAGGIPTTWGPSTTTAVFGDCRSDCAHGFPMGPWPTIWSAIESRPNVTCVYHPINFKSTTGYGIQNNCGPNSPIHGFIPAAPMSLSPTGLSICCPSRST